MSEMGDDFKYMRELSKIRKASNEDRHVILLEESGLHYKSVGNGTYLIRHGEISVDLYATTNKWKDNKTGKFHHGDSTSFCNWLAKRIQ